MQLLPRLNEGGVERGTIEMNREFVKNGLRSIVVSAGGKLSNIINQDGGIHINYDIASKNIFTFLPRIGGLRKIIDEVKPDIIHARSRLPAWLAKFANSKNRIPFVTTVHGINSVNFYSRIMTLSDHVICVGDPVKNHIVRNYELSPEKISVIPRGVDLDYFDPEKVNLQKKEKLREKFQLNGFYVIGVVGRISRVKNYELIIKSIAQLTSDNRKICGLFVGGEKKTNDNYSNGLKDLANKLCPGAIRWVGSSLDMREVYSCCDVVVNASPLMGNVARTLLESVAMGKPILSTSMDGLSHLVDPGVNGFIFNANKPNSLTEKISVLMNNPLCNVRDTLPRSFQLESMVNSTISVYRKLVL